MYEKFFDTLQKLYSFEKLDLKNLIKLSDEIGINTSSLEHDLSKVVKERIFMHLIGNVQKELNYRDRKKYVEARLKSISNNRNIKDLVEVISEIQARISDTVNQRKEGITNIAETIASDLLEEQNYRCFICGVPLQERARKKIKFLKNTLEPLVEIQLDHKLPFYLFGNFDNRQLLCKFCNILKSDRLGVHEDGFVLNSNHLRRDEKNSIRRRMGFWTLENKNFCQEEGCSAKFTDSILWVRVKHKNRAWSYGNLIVECSEHAKHNSEWIHHESYMET